MRWSVMLGIALLVAGGTVFLRDLSDPARRDVLNGGGVSVPAEERNPIVPWATGFAMLAGIALLATRTRRRA